ncbi:MAG: class I SAM-dependent rRNA methyltransferase [Isosphaeraceae bacterium]
MSSSGRVVLKPRRARPFFARHPWVFDSSIEHVAGDPAAGDIVDVWSHEGKFIARGMYNPTSSIRARLYRWDDGPLDQGFWSEALAAAIRLRSQILGLGTSESAYRLVFSEGDGLSGLTVDRYDRWLVAEFTSLALYHHRQPILEALVRLTGALGVVARTGRSVALKEGLSPGEESIIGSVPSEPVLIEENGLSFLVDLRSGQKTGFYLDQRLNRRAAAGYCRGKHVLDLCCFSGGFSLNAVKHGGAAATLGIDSSGPAIELARRQAEINGVTCAQFEAGDVIKALERLRTAGQRFGVVICDPPKYATQAKDVERAIKGYLRLNLAAVEVLEPEGILVTCSCSGLVGRELFVEVIGSVAEQSGRPIQILEQRGQAPDHPVSASCLETEYLKCLICRVGS